MILSHGLHWKKNLGRLSSLNGLVWDILRFLFICGLLKGVAIQRVHFIFSIIFRLNCIIPSLGYFISIYFWMDLVFLVKLKWICCSNNDL